MIAGGDAMDASEMLREALLGFSTHVSWSAE